MADVKEKEFLVRTSRKLGSMKEIYVEGGGEVPGALDGFFTDASTAQKSIDQYLLTRRNRAYRKKAD
jgi:hypothetical protein